ncbi:hypothetical protein HU200_001185 [Digitaria exilis]|uniref:Uncharacterized protein n=1 Tax=Digitaria exilis TaxID=1010633 RepID=A0A835G0J9_9POAL|nr:hypothetical protein HU200_001185 [Digitaria exilis]
MPVRVVDTATPSSQSSPGQDTNAGHPSPPRCVTWNRLPRSALAGTRGISFAMVWDCFAGTQNVSSLQKDEAWKVNVRIHGCDLEQGYLCGTMEALNVPLADTPVSSDLLGGEIVDAKITHFSLASGKHREVPEDDIRHWSKFPHLHLFWWVSINISVIFMRSPFQKLELKCTNERSSGFTFSSYELQ